MKKCTVKHRSAATRAKCPICGKKSARKGNNSSTESHNEIMDSLDSDENIIDADSSTHDLVEDPPGLEPGTIVENDDGYLIASYNDTISGYGLYKIGDKTRDPGIARQLHELDRRKKYQEGWCDDLSHTLYASNPDITEIYEFRNEAGDMWHSIARHRNGTFIDSLGAWSEDDLDEYWDAIAQREDEEYFELYRLEPDEIKIREDSGPDDIVSFINEKVIPDSMK